MFFSSDPAVSSSIFVGAEREENLKIFFVHYPLVDVAGWPVSNCTGLEVALMTTALVAQENGVANFSVLQVATLFFQPTNQDVELGAVQESIVKCLSDIRVGNSCRRQVHIYLS